MHGADRDNVYPFAPRTIDGQGACAERPVAGRPAGGDRRAAESSLVPGDAVPSGIQIPATPPASAVQRICGGGPPPKVRPLSRDAETGSQLCSRLDKILNVARDYASSLVITCGLVEEPV